MPPLSVRAKPLSPSPLWTEARPPTVSSPLIRTAAVVLPVVTMVPPAAVVIPVTPKAGQNSFNVTINTQTLNTLVRENMKRLEINIKGVVVGGMGAKLLKWLDTLSANRWCISPAEKKRRLPILTVTPSLSVCLMPRQRTKRPEISMRSMWMTRAEWNCHALQGTGQFPDSVFPASHSWAGSGFCVAFWISIYDF